MCPPAVSRELAGRSRTREYALFVLAGIATPLGCFATEDVAQGEFGPDRREPGIRPDSPGSARNGDRFPAARHLGRWRSRGAQVDARSRIAAGAQALRPGDCRAPARLRAGCRGRGPGDVAQGAPVSARAAGSPAGPARAGRPQPGVLRASHGVVPDPSRAGLGAAGNRSLRGRRGKPAGAASTGGRGVARP